MLESDDRCKALTGLTTTDVLDLYNLCEHHVRETTTRKEDRQREAKQGSLAPWLAFVGTLVWLWQYPTGAALEVLTGVDAALMQRHIDRVLVAMDKALEKEMPNIFKWTDDQWKAFIAEQAETIRHDAGFLKDGKICLVIDGTEVVIYRPLHADHKKRFSGKKKQYALNLLIVCSLDGRIVWVSPEAHDGSPNDQAQWKKHPELRELLRKHGAGILGDGGFFPNTAEQGKAGQLISAFTPVRRPTKDPKTKKRAALAPAQRLFNLLVSQHRVIVENVIGRLKRWKVLSTLYRRYHYTPDKPDKEKSERQELGLIARVLAKLHNFLDSRAGKQSAPVSDVAPRSRSVSPMKVDTHLARSKSPARKRGWRPNVSAAEKRIQEAVDALVADDPKYKRSPEYASWRLLRDKGKVNGLGVLPSERRLPDSEAENVLIIKHDRNETWKMLEDRGVEVTVHYERGELRLPSSDADPGRPPKSVPVGVSPMRQQRENPFEVAPTPRPGSVADQRKKRAQESREDKRKKLRAEADAVRTAAQSAADAAGVASRAATDVRARVQADAADPNKARMVPVYEMEVETGIRTFVGKNTTVFIANPAAGRGRVKG